MSDSSVSWAGYGPIRGLSATRFEDLSRKEARAEFELIMTALLERVVVFGT